MGVYGYHPHHYYLPPRIPKKSKRGIEMTIKDIEDLGKGGAWEVKLKIQAMQRGTNKAKRHLSIFKNFFQKLKRAFGGRG